MHTDVGECVLGDVCDAQVRVALDEALVRLQLAHHQLHQGGLAYVAGQC